jgi:hypothetical protein
MLRKLGLGISYFIAIVYILSFIVPLLYCLPHCGGQGLDAFLPAFALTPFGAIATAFALHNAVQHIRKDSPPAIYWPIAIIFSIVLLGIIALILVIIYMDIAHR